MQRILVLLLVIILMGCSSKPAKVNYYMLYTPSHSSDNITPGVKAQKVTLNKLLLADYLQQSSLAMQYNQNQIYFSPKDVWAEGLQSSIFNVLLAELNQNEKRQFNAYQTPYKDGNNTEVTVQIDHFHATDQSTVVSSGYFWIDLPTGQEPIKKAFHISLPVKEDGYSNAVLQLKAVLHELAQQIQQELGVHDQ